jgi:hypothetical protein
MIGNNDFSTYAPHNEKLMEVDGKIVPIPYDFDLSGLVNASYAVVSVNPKITETSVTIGTKFLQTQPSEKIIF